MGKNVVRAHGRKSWDLQFLCKDVKESRGKLQVDQERLPKDKEFKKCRISSHRWESVTTVIFTVTTNVAEQKKTNIVGLSRWILLSKSTDVKCRCCIKGVPYPFRGSQVLRILRMFFRSIGKRWWSVAHLLLVFPCLRNALKCRYNPLKDGEDLHQGSNLQKSQVRHPWKRHADWEFFNRSELNPQTSYAPLHMIGGTIRIFSC